MTEDEIQLDKDPNKDSSISGNDKLLIASEANESNDMFRSTILI